MKNLALTLFFLFTFVITPSVVSAQGMMGNVSSSPSSIASFDHTTQEEAEGKEIWGKLQAKQLECKNLTENAYQALGEYFMGQAIGETQRHVLMNQMMTNMIGEDGEKQMHITMGKRFSGCDTDASYPQNGWGFMPMMWMMGGGVNPMMGGWNGFGLLGWIPMLLFWVLLIVGVVALIRYLGRSGQSHKTPLDLLKERYASGEIDKKEFEEKKKDLI